MDWVVDNNELAKGIRPRGIVLSSQEDEAIVQLVKKLGTKRWAEVAARMSERYGLQERSGKQCRERWHNHLDPAITKRPWSE